ncbi:hypothetical protein VTJ49DRAFT_7394 [Mycothermus thermophilus]|uniref:GH16 domain-containing protein n=1 Tax=Humicola insolens TaxID=85995 RepID=A0ABR3VH93_HUMIN
MQPQSWRLGPAAGTGVPPPGCWHLVPEVSEITIGSLSSVVIWKYTVQGINQRGNVSSEWPDLGENTGDDFFHPSPGLMLFACLAFGCCVSSFAHRRQSRDPFQAVIYPVVLGAAVLIGLSLRADAHLVLLGYLPWATCAAMIISMSIHGLCRRLRPQVSRTIDEEKRSHRNPCDARHCTRAALNLKPCIPTNGESAMFTHGWRRATAAVTATAITLLGNTAFAQTWSACNPLLTSGCPANTALGMTINVDFTQGEVNSFLPSGGTPTYGPDGVSFTVARSGNAPQLESIFYIMFGRVEVTMKAAPGAGIVSSLVLLSDALDEIDMEWLGSDPNEVQTNFFSQGRPIYTNAQFNPAPNNQAEFTTYIIDWTADRIIWYVGGTVVRTVHFNDAPDLYPQTPMQIKFGAWAGGDPSNPPGTIEWARGPTDFSQGPFSMVVRSAVITDYSTGKQYTYSDASGKWQSIRSEGGAINGNLGAAQPISATVSAPPVTTHTASPTVPQGGIIGGSSTGTGPVRTVGPIPDGWVMTSDGKVVPIGGSSTVNPPKPIPLLWACLALWWLRR